jgi:hypothetical protein
VGAGQPGRPRRPARPGRAGGRPPAGRRGRHPAARDAYQSLRDHLHALGIEAQVAADLDDLLGRHLEALDGALQGAAGDGLGPPAGRLVGLRDLLRRTIAVGGRPVSDVIPGV